MKRTLLTLAAALFLLPASAQQVPEWLKEGILYHIYPSSFKDSDGDGIGDLEGIRSKLPYVKSLGANTIWLSPVFRSEFEDGGYDITDFYRIDPRFGTNSQLVQLVREAHDLGIRVCLDLVARRTNIRGSVSRPKPIRNCNTATTISGAIRRIRSRPRNSFAATPRATATT